MEGRQHGQRGTETAVAPIIAEAASGSVLAHPGRVRRGLWGRDQGGAGAWGIRGRGNVAAARATQARAGSPLRGALIELMAAAGLVRRVGPT